MLLVVARDLDEAFGAEPVRIAGQDPGEQEGDRACYCDADGDRGKAVHLRVLDANGQQEHAQVSQDTSPAGNVGPLG